MFTSIIHERTRFLYTYFRIHTLFITWTLRLSSIHIGDFFMSQLFLEQVRFSYIHIGKLSCQLFLECTRISYILENFSPQFLKVHTRYIWLRFEKMFTSIIHERTRFSYIAEFAHIIYTWTLRFSYIHMETFHISITVSWSNVDTPYLISTPFFKDRNDKNNRFTDRRNISSLTALQSLNQWFRLISTFS